MAGIAGALYVPQVGIINPSEFAPANSIETVIWVAVGGRGTLIGADPRRGRWSTSPRPGSPQACSRRYWLFVLGGLFIVVTLFLPHGIVGTLRARLSARAAPTAPADERRPAPARRRRAARRPTE